LKRPSLRSVSAEFEPDVKREHLTYSGAPLALASILDYAT
jgi:hypothetical protein